MTVRNDVIEAVVEVCGIDVAALVDGATLESLGIDSLDLIEIAMIIEDQHDTQISGDDFEDVTTFGGAVAVFDRVAGDGSEA